MAEPAIATPPLADGEIFALTPDRLTQLEFGFPVSAPGVAIDTPRHIDAQRRDTLPVLIAMRYDGLRNWDVKADVNTVLVVTDLETGHVLAAKPFVRDKRLSDRPVSNVGPPPEGLDRAAMHSGLDLLDARKYLPIPWRASHLAVTVLVYDWRSSTRTVKLESQEAATQLELPRSESPPEPWLRQGAALAAAAPPMGGGELTFTVAPSGAPHGPAAWARLHVPAGLRRPPTATLIMFQKDSTGLRMLPVELDNPDSGGETASFAIDLQSAFEGELDGDYVAYLAAYGHVAGPARVRFHHTPFERRPAPESPSPYDET